MEDDKLNPFKIAQVQFDAAAELLGLDPGMREFLRWPMREYKFMVPLKMDDGSTQVFHAYRVQYNNARGPNKQLLPQVVNAWLDEYIQHENTHRTNSDDALDSALASERTVLQRRIETKRGEVEAFKRDHDIQSMQRDENVVSARLRGLTEDLNKAESRVAEQQGNLQSLRWSLEPNAPARGNAA